MVDVSSSALDLAAKGVSIVGLLVLSFLAGAYTAEFEVFPYPQLLDNSFEALRAYRERIALTNPDPKASGQWRRVEDWESGVVRHDESKTEQGYTLFTSAHSTAAYLIDMNGEVVHEWGLPFRAAFPEGGRVPNPLPEHKLHWSDAHLFPDGDLIGMFTGEGDTPYGYGLVKLDADNEIVWTYDGRAHHDFDVTEDGSIWLLTQTFRNLDESPIEGGPNWADRALEDFLVELSPSGEELRRISLIDAVAGYERDVIRRWFEREPKWDLLHMNDVDEVGADFAEHHDFAEPGQILFSSRSLSAIGLLDPETGEVVWMQTGFWDKQHDPDTFPNGQMLIFDNRGYGGSGGNSQVARFDPQSGRVVWSFHGSEQRRFHCPWWGKQTPLSGGNVLIADSLNARILEVDQNREIVWEWHSPAVTESNGVTYAANVKAPVERIEPESLEFEPSGPLGRRSMLYPASDRFREE